MRAGAFLIILGLLATPAQAAAEDPSICADRPGKATGTCSVPSGRVQLETGLADWSLLDESGSRDTSLTVGETVLKYGLTSRSDLELDIAPYIRSASRRGGHRDSASGFGDLTLLYKHRLTGDGTAVEVAALPFVKVPTAKRSIGNRKFEAGLLLPIGYAIPNTPLTLGATPEIDRLADEDRHGRHWAMAQVISLGWTATGRLSISGELWGQWDWDPDGTVRQYSADGSVAYLLRNDLQLDAGANFGLNRVTPDVELYAGVSKRF